MSQITGPTAKAPTEFQVLENTINRGNVFSKNDAAGAAKGGVAGATLLVPPMIASKPDMMKCMAAFEDLIILMSKMAKEVQVGERESEMASLAAKITELLSSADKKMSGANKMRAMAIASMVVSVVAATISAVGAGLQLGGALKGASAAAKSVDKAAKQVGDSAGGAATAMSKADKITLATKAFEAGSAKLTKSGMFVDSIGKAAQGVGGYLSSEGQVQNQQAMAKADRMAAAAEKEGAAAARAQQVQQDMRELLGKMVELLNAFYAAQDKIAGAASH